VLIDSIEDPFEKVPRAQEENLMQNPTTSDPIQVSFDLESPHKRLREVSIDELKPQRKTKSKPTSPHQPLLILPHRCLPQILRMADTLHL
jgi:hypothetical protein